jgi:hypothetical protein
MIEVAAERRATKPLVYAYYEEPPGGHNPLRWYYELCWETVKAWTPEARLLSRKDVEEIVGPYPPEVETLYVVHRVDWVRKAVIAEVGGMWVDMDFICWSDLTPLAGFCTACDYVGYREGGGGWMDHLFGGRAGSALVVEMAEHALGRAKLDGPQMSWTATSTQTVEHVLAKFPWHVVLQLPTHVVMPLSFSLFDFYFGPCDQPDEEKWWRSFGFMTSLHTLRDRLSRTFNSAQDLLRSDTWLAAIMRRGLRIGKA